MHCLRIEEGAGHIPAGKMRQKRQEAEVGPPQSSLLDRGAFITSPWLQLLMMVAQQGY